MISTYQILALCVLPAILLAQTCQSPVVTSKVDTSNDAILSGKTAFIVEFNVACKNSASNVDLYAEFNGAVFPVARNGNNYQVSFVDEHKSLPAGKYVVRMFDEEGFSNLKKQQRSGEETQAKSLFDIDINHNGLSKGKYVQSELIALIAFAGICYYASVARSQLHK